MLLGACAVARCRRAQEASITRVYDTLPYGGRDERGHITLQYLNGLDAIMASRSTLEILSQYDSFLQNKRDLQASERRFRNVQQADETRTLFQHH